MKKRYPKILYRRKFLKIIGYSLIGSFGYGSYSYFNSKQTNRSWTGEILNSPAKLEIHNVSNSKNRKILAAVEKQVNKYESIFNLQNYQSEINQLNKNKYLSQPTNELLEVIEKSLLLSKNTNGAFDATVQPLWDFYYKHYILNQNKVPPKRAKLKVVQDLVNWNNIILSKNSIKLSNNASITLNGIAQGWITDKITELLKRFGIKNTLVDFGENYALGLYENQRPWRILLQGPGNITKVIDLSNKAVATSGGYGTAFEPTITYHHIFDPKTGLSANNYKAVSILSDHAWLSDGLSTAALSMDKSSLLKVCKKFDTTPYIIEKDKFNLLV